MNSEDVMLSEKIQTHKKINIVMILLRIVTFIETASRTVVTGVKIGSRKL